MWDSDRSRMSVISYSTPLSSLAMSSTHWATVSALQPGRKLPAMIPILTMRSFRPNSISVG